MKRKFNVVAISGSTRQRSSNLNLIKAIASLTAEIVTITIFEGLTAIPHFNPDLDIENAPQQVLSFRKLVKEADGILICTPEYAIGVPGTLKNSIDWTVSSMEFSKKPVALITASTSGIKAHESLLGTLLIIEAKITDETQLLISSVKTKVNERCEITHDETRVSINKLIQSFTEVMKGNDRAQHYLSPPLLG